MVNSQQQNCHQLTCVFQPHGIIMGFWDTDPHMWRKITRSAFGIMNGGLWNTYFPYWNPCWDPNTSCPKEKLQHGHMATSSLFVSRWSLWPRIGSCAASGTSNNDNMLSTTWSWSITLVYPQQVSGFKIEPAGHQQHLLQGGSTWFYINSMATKWPWWWVVATAWQRDTGLQSLPCGIPEYSSWAP